MELFGHNYPALLVLSVLVIMILFKFHKRNSIENKPLFMLSDSIGLVSFSISGAIIGMQADFNLAGIIAMAFTTAVGGGIVRDVIINEVPFVLKTGFYGTISILIAIILYLLNLYHLVNFINISIVFAIFLTLRIFAYYKEWSIPLK